MTTPGEVKIPLSKRSLIHAADSGDIECVKRLIGDKHNVNEKYKGLSKAFNSLSVPLHYACRSGHLEVVKLLIENGADIDAVDIENWTSLHYCCNNGHDDIVAYLMAQGIDQTAKDVVYKNSALQFAKHRQFYKIIKLLSPKESFGTYKRLSLAVPKPVDKPIYSPGSTLFLLRYSFKNRASDEEKLTTWRKNPFSKSIILSADDKELDGQHVLLIFDHEFDNHKRNSTSFDGVIRTSAISTHEFIVVVKATV